MNNSSQIQLKISLSRHLNNLLELKASKLGVPVTQFVKHLILKDVENIVYPTFIASKELERNIKKGLDEIENATDGVEFLEGLNES